MTLFTVTKAGSRKAFEQASAKGPVTVRRYNGMDWSTVKLESRKRWTNPIQAVVVKWAGVDRADIRFEQVW